MRKLIVLIVCLVALNDVVCSQASHRERDSIYQLSAADHRLMKEQLGISVPNRPGRSGTPGDANAANSDESKVGAYQLPELMLLKNGKKVTTPNQWLQRRQEIATLFETEMYGRIPEKVPSVTWKVISEKDTVTGKYPIKEKRLIGSVDNSAHPAISVEIELLLAVPANVVTPVPVVMEFGFINWPFGRPPAEPTSFLFSRNEPDWKSQLISQGWGYAILVPSSIQDDNGAGLRSGIIGLANKGEPRKPDDWGALRAWAWGASRALDYFESDRAVDAKRVAIEGLSRYGKAAIVAMAFDERFSLGFIGSSGAGGAKILRRDFGEQMENLGGVGEYHWFCGNFIKYASAQTVHELPVDAHQLVAMCAPRPVFISSGSPHEEGQWVDAKGMFEAGVYAEPIYKLYGKQGLGISQFPPIGRPLIDGEIAWRQHAGGHSTGPNWSTWIGWAHRYWDSK